MNYQKTRNTTETKLEITLSDDNAPSNIKTGVGFLDHMLTLFSFHSKLTLNIEANGDIEVDDHHVTDARRLAGDFTDHLSPSCS